MKFSDYLQRQAKIIKRMTQSGKMSKKEWVDRYAALYREKIQQRYGVILPS